MGVRGVTVGIRTHTLGDWNKAVYTYLLKEPVLEYSYKFHLPKSARVNSESDLLGEGLMHAPKPCCLLFPSLAAYIPTIAHFSR